MADVVTPPPLHGPTSKEKKYDRQLRLWAASGQAALEEAHILLINSGTGTVGVEALKNLVLPGIGNFTILDSATVTEADLGVNFFLEDTSLGKFRAGECCKYLQELNPDVKGNFISEPLETFVAKPNVLQPFTHILITAPIALEILEKISNDARFQSRPVFYVHCVGFYAQLSLQLPDAFPIVDTHPDPEKMTDLRILWPFRELREFAARKTKDLGSMNDHDHGHVPYVLLLLHYLSIWKSQHNGRPPQNYKEKTEFRELVRSGTRRDNPEGGEENFDEAVGAVLKSLNLSEPSSAIKEIFDSAECCINEVQRTNFWIITRAVKTFHQQHGSLPLPGSLPDMKAQSKDYIELQNVYKAKARKDVAEVLSHARKLEKGVERLPPADPEISEKEVEAFCKNAGFIKLIRGRPLKILKPKEMLKWGRSAKSASNALTNPDSLMPLHLAFLAYDSFSAAHAPDGHIATPQAPGASDFETDAQKMTGIVETLIDDLLRQARKFIEDPEYSEIKDSTAKIAQEMTRAGGAELHNIASLTGGIVAQEVIKVITKQYVPVDNVCLVDGVQSKTSVLKL
ncbi:hypothetical protein EV356DRAFT_438073 [Viridothelium virens]|uniref:NEDD8-activating enzyme E1 regulatory subunit n=1 Tax=Viridothelium virens TaxID=1048519 RepID=A0A6A6HPE9_VIRVR|nr:hypothetical protein EV356DRAFT_438073 [Viridothelium virens]